MVHGDCAAGVMVIVGMDSMVDFVSGVSEVEQSLKQPQNLG